jgi:hypothetical protein
MNPARPRNESIGKSARAEEGLDNSPTHTTPAVQAWLAVHSRGHFHFTPKGDSWLSLVEAWFSILTRKWLLRDGPSAHSPHRALSVTASVILWACSPTVDARIASTRLDPP